jgi:hypothetical protein
LHDYRKPIRILPNQYRLDILPIPDFVFVYNIWLELCLMGKLVINIGTAMALMAEDTKNKRFGKRFPVPEENVVETRASLEDGRWKVL